MGLCSCALHKPAPSSRKAHTAPPFPAASAQFYKLTNSHQQISSYVFDVVRATVPKMDLDDVFTVRPLAYAELRHSVLSAGAGACLCSAHAVVPTVV